jgi:hypothetical protein
MGHAFLHRPQEVHCSLTRLLTAKGFEDTRANIAPAGHRYLHQNRGIRRAQAAMPPMKARESHWRAKPLGGTWA